jgi:hypothetical protein
VFIFNSKFGVWQLIPTANPNEQTPEVCSTLQFNSPQTTPSNTVIIEASPSQNQTTRPWSSSCSKILPSSEWHRGTNTSCYSHLKLGAKRLRLRPHNSPRLENLNFSHPSPKHLTKQSPKLPLAPMYFTSWLTYIQQLLREWDHHYPSQGPWKLQSLRWHHKPIKAFSSSSIVQSNIWN